MKNTTSKDKSDLKSDLITGTSAAVGATIGMVAGNALASEVYAAEMPEEQSAQDSQTAHSNVGHNSSTHGQETVASTTHTQPSEPEPIMEPDPTIEPEPSLEPEPVLEPEPIPVEPNENPEVLVVDYYTVTNENESQMDVAVVSIDGQEAYLIDENQDGHADVLMSDINGDGNIDYNESLNIEDESISMSPFQTEVMGDSHGLIAESDYVNDANVDDYMA